MDIRETQIIELDILLAFDRLCREKKLIYFLGYGTLLGAVRHKGFIPWDDDIDVCMPRKEYQKLMQLADHEQAGRYRLVSWRNGGSAYPFLKMIDSDTVIHEKYTTGASLSSVWIDIFPMDTMPENDRLLKAELAEVNALRALLLLSISNPEEGTSAAMRAAKKVLVPACRHLNQKKLCADINRLAMRHRREHTGYIGNYVWNEGAKEKMPVRILDLTTLPFEGHTFPAPVNYDEYLTAYFGDYMQLPPEAQRVPHGFEVTWRETHEG